MSKNKTSEAQKAATKRYREKNRERTRIQSARSAAKTFINNYSTLDDLEALEQLIEQRKKELNTL